MFWKLDPPGSSKPDAVGWLPGNRSPKPRAVPKRIVPAAGKPKSAYANRDQIYVAMSEAVLRTLVAYPGAIAETASAIELRPEQSREAHFDAMMEAISDAASKWPGLDEAIATALEPFARDPIWDS